jgi:hypothetical protein
VEGLAMRNAVNAFLLCLVAGVLLCCPVHLDAQVDVLIANIRVSHSLSAVVIDPDGIPVQDVVVEEVDQNWNKTLRATKTDASGMFAFSPMKGRKIYYFRLSKYEFKRTLFRMKVSSMHRKTLRVQMESAD